MRLIKTMLLLILIENNIRLDNALNKDYALAYEGSQEGGNSYVYQTPGRGLYTNLRYNF